MAKTILAIGTLALLGSLLLLNQGFDLDENTKNFQNFKVKYNKKYGSTEEAYRLAIYTQNVLYAQEYNAKKGKNVFGETMFFDLTDQEFAEIYLTLKVDEELPLERVTFPLNGNADSIDWTTKGAVTAVKDQGQCPASWAFQTTGVLEGFFFIQTGELPNLSEQQLVDCAAQTVIFRGCNGGMIPKALNYVIKNGITTQDAYPYKGVDGFCQTKGGAYKISSYITIDATEESFIAAIQQQPVSVAVDAQNWKYYNPATTEKIFSDCGDTLNHGVLAVGYNDESIKIKNSWSASWGDAGYIHLKSGGNTCGVWNLGQIILEP